MVLPDQRTVIQITSTSMCELVTNHLRATFLNETVASVRALFSVNVAACKYLQIFQTRHR
eukprot:m.47699 g.47699  ORF g.47699 m.47699 type:complete len:60 (-) comp20556_c1_seq1:114-293(-)